jgi:D-3-phosphoglycerate dehydrogenase
MYNKPKALITTKKFAEVSRDPIKKLEEAGFVVEERNYDIVGSLTEEKFCQMLQGVDVLIGTGMHRVTRKVIESADRLKMIAIRGTGFDGVDIKAAQEKGVLVTHNPGANAESVADTAVGLMLAVLKKITKLDRKIRGGGWERERTLDMNGKVLGIIGLGRIGKLVVKRVQGFDMLILANDIVEYKEFLEKYSIESVNKEELMERADIVTLHTPLDRSTRCMIGEERLRLMKNTGILINTARGPIVDEKALYKALKENWIAGAGLDVHMTEPPSFRPLVELDNVVSTCHIAGLSEGASYNMSMQTVDKVITYFRGGMPESALTPGMRFPGKSILSVESQELDNTKQ